MNHRLHLCVLLLGALGCGGPAAGGELDAATQERFTVSEGTVMDRATGLEWQQSASATAYDFPRAFDACVALSLNGGNWRLPTVRELISIVDFSRRNSSIDVTVFPGAPNRVFWTSTRHAQYTDSVWTVSFVDGALSYASDAAMTSVPDWRVRCVRGPELTGPSLTIDGDAVFDSTSGLTWQRGEAAGLFSQSEASTYCSGLALQGGTWRLPTAGEMLSIVDFSRTSPPLDVDVFLEPSTDQGFWTTSSPATDEGWNFSFSGGGALYNNNAANPYHVKCVR